MAQYIQDFAQGIRDLLMAFWDWVIWGLGTFLGLVTIALAFVFNRRPSLERDWSPDQAVMPEVTFHDHDRVEIRNIRNIHYRTTRDYDVAHYDRTIKLGDVETAWLAIAPFSGFGAAHAFMSFGLKDGSYIAVSIEIRRQKGEKFHPVPGALNQFEMMYVIADERDVVRVRTNCAKYEVRLYPVMARRETIQLVFSDVLKRAEKLRREPEFYNTLFNNCTTNIIKHVRRFGSKPVPRWSLRYVFPEFLDRVAHRLSILDTDKRMSHAREFYNITPIAQEYGDGEDFSRAIREKIMAG